MIAPNKQKILENIKKILDEEISEIRMFFYTSNKKICQPKLIKTTYKEIKTSYLSSLYKIIDKVGDIAPFDLDGNLDNELVYLNPVEEDIKDYLTLFELISNDDCFVLESNKVKSFYNNVRATIFVINNKITLIKKFSYPKRLLKKSILNIKKYPLEQVEEDIFSLDNRIDAFELDGTVYILNNNAFETIFSLESEYQSKINATISLLKDSELIEGVEEFKNECLNHKSRTKRLLKLLNKNNFNVLKEKKELIKEVIDTYSLTIELSEEGKIVYSDKQEIGEILNILGDNYYISSILQEKRLAKSSQEIKN